jgi:hypothetical protein
MGTEYRSKQITAALNPDYGKCAVSNGSPKNKAARRSPSTFR